MLKNFIEKYKDPELVAEIQRFFGVDIHYDKANIFPKERNGCVVSKTQDLLSSQLSKRQNLNITDNSEEEPLNSEDSSTKNGFKELNSKLPYYTIKSNFWYYIFRFSTELGDELFYTTFIPFWFWNIDGAVGRRIVLVWATVMTFGQALKDILCWPRPSCPPAVRLQEKWSLEYGMPSTHAMIAVSIPFSIILFTMNRYIYPLYAGLLGATLWCTMICLSRLYLGMHTVLDVAVGLLLAILLMIPLVPFVDSMDYYFVTNTYAMLGLVLISIITIIYYPISDRWTPTRGDTALVVSVTAGIHLGTWLNYKTGILLIPSIPPPYQIIWPSYSMFGTLILRTVLGFCCVLGTKALCKTLSYATLCAILKINSKELMNSKNSLENKNKIFVDLVYKYISCFVIGINTVYLLPSVYSVIGIERPTFYTEL